MLPPTTMASVFCAVSVMCEPHCVTRFSSYLSTQGTVLQQGSNWVSVASVVVPDTVEESNEQALSLLRSMVLGRDGFSRRTHRMFATSRVSPSMPSMIAALGSCLPADCVLRLQSHPPKHFQSLSDSLEEAGFALSPTAFTHVLVSIFVGKCDREEVQSENSVLWGVVNGKDEWQSFIELHQTDKGFMGKKAGASRLNSDVEALDLNAPSSPSLPVDGSAGDDDEDGRDGDADGKNRASYKLIETLQLLGVINGEGTLTPSRIGADATESGHDAVGAVSGSGEQRWQPGRSITACDVGAAPGGWTKLLANLPCIRHVVAIDPGLLDDRVVSHPNVTHIALKAEDAVRAQPGVEGAVESAGAVTSSVLGRCGFAPFGLVVCDSNSDARDTARDMVLPLAAFIDKGAPLILTVKLIRRASESLCDSRVRDVISILQSEFEGFRSEWLFGNSKCERTIICYRR